MITPTFNTVLGRFQVENGRDLIQILDLKGQITFFVDEKGAVHHGPFPQPITLEKSGTVKPPNWIVYLVGSTHITATLTTTDLKADSIYHLVNAGERSATVRVESGLILDRKEIELKPGEGIQLTFDGVNFSVPEKQSEPAKAGKLIPGRSGLIAPVVSNA